MKDASLVTLVFGRFRHLATALAVLVMLAPVPAAAQQLLRVPEDVPDLQQAIHQVADGGVIELAGGSYPSPASGFRIADERKGFTIRSAAGQRAVLDGGGARPLLAFVNRSLGSGGPVRFERLTFRRGLADDEPITGGVTVRAAEALFVDCDFEDIVTRSVAVGGAMGIGEGAVVTIQGGAFRRNSTGFAGGAAAVVDSTLVVAGTRFTANRTNLPGHVENAVGGAVFVLSSDVSISDSVFERNEAALVGGAIYVFGHYPEGASGGAAPDAVVRIARSTFRGNLAVPNPCCAAPAPTGGGAIHAEDAARVEIDDSWFVGNRGRFGGAVQSFRAELDVDGSIFEDNEASQPGEPLGLGGGLAALSSAGVSEPGVPNRPPASVTVRSTLFRGLSGGGPSATMGGCLQTSGDRAELDAGRGGLAENRAPLSLTRVALAGCRTERLGGGPSFGGAVAVDMAALDGSRVLVVGSVADGTVGLGGALSSRIESAVELSDSTFAGNQAVFSGGAIYAGGAPVLDVADSRFFENRVGAGAAAGVQGSRGAAIFTETMTAPSGPGRSPDARGTVEGSLFAANLGLEIRDSESGPGRNRIRYDGNRFFSTVFGSLVYGHSSAAPSGLAPSGLDALVVPGSPPIDKSVVSNSLLPSRPSDGDLLVFPPAGAQADRSPALAAYAWSGGGATLVTPNGNRALGPLFGVIEIDEGPGTYALRVDGGEVASDTFAEAVPPLPPGPFLATADLPGFRFKAQIVAAGQAITGRQEPGCIAETVCVSGALAGRSEVFLRVVGPKPNGYLQPTLVKFSTSRARIWIEQTGTGALRYYELDPVSAGDGRLATLDGLIDRKGFLPTGSASSAATSDIERLRGGAALEALGTLGARATTGPPPPIPSGGKLTTAAIPGFRFTVRITAAGTERLGRKEGDCIEETLCVSGAVPGRSEIFLRVVGPKPNGFLQPTIVTFSTSTIEIWIERPARGDVRYYRIDGLSGGAGDIAGLDGAIDREGFLP